MAVHLDADKAQQFEHLFLSPSIDKMHQLSPDDFELFVGHIFTCAGYDVDHMAQIKYPEGPGVDLDLYAQSEQRRSRHLVARVEVRRYAPERWITLQQTREFVGTLQIAGGGIPGYLVTTSDFAANAYQAEKDLNGKVRLINGDRLLRYIAYIGGSFYADEQGVRRTPWPVSPDWLFTADEMVRQQNRKSTILTIANNRGGIGKTTTTLNLGFALAQTGKRVLLVDMDGQSSLTLAVPPPPDAPEAKGAPPAEHKRFISEYFSGHTADLAQLVQPTRFDNISLLPANGDLHRMDSGGSAHPNKELAFVEALHNLDVGGVTDSESDQGFDWIIIDTPPAQSFYTRAALAASDYVLIPINVEAFAARGIARLLDTAHAMRGLMGAGVNVLGVTITRWKPIPAAQKDKWTALQADLKAEDLPLLGRAIPQDDKIDMAHLSTLRGGAKNIFKIGNKLTPAAEAYIELLVKVKESINGKRNQSN